MASECCHHSCGVSFVAHYIRMHISALLPVHAHISQCLFVVLVFKRSYFALDEFRLLYIRDVLDRACAGLPD